jgi:CheY-like chemotaxis protein
MLQPWGIEVRTADSASAALEALKEFPADLLISDIGMPGEDGYTFIQKVRNRKSESDLPAIALTAHVRVEDRQRALEAGYQKHLAKPIEPALLLAAVRALCGRTAGV